MTSLATNESNSSIDNLIECSCPFEFKDECIKQPICVYGINDNGNIFFNGMDDSMNLTIIALQRKAEINNTDDILVNLYNPISMVIFYYGCQRCDDLKQFGNITLPKLRVFLLSLYNQRMKYNIKYSQSDFVDFSSNLLNDERRQPMPEITVRPFWKNRLMFNETCANKKREFTQKHFIPAFLTQDLCILDYKMINYLSINETYQTSNGEIIYSPTLSYNDLYSFNILPNSSDDIPADKYSGKREACKITLDLTSDIRILRFFCLCPKHDCTLKVTTHDPLQCCPYKLETEFNVDTVYSSIDITSEFMSVDKFFEQSENTFCHVEWTVYNNEYRAFFLKGHLPFPDGYSFEYIYQTISHQPSSFCPFVMYEHENVGAIDAVFYRNDSKQLLDAFMNGMIDHLVFTDVFVGANCSSEGLLSHYSYSAAYGSNSAVFPCYKYFDLYFMNQIFPMIGINILPIKIIAKGKQCYYYSVKAYKENLKGCELKDQFPPFMIISGCPENVEISLKEVLRMRKIINACPTMKSNESQWKYETIGSSQATLCGQFLRGIKLENGKYIPKEIELRTVTMKDLEMIGISNNNTYFHGCGFNPSQNLTLCTCFSVLGGCDYLYTAGRIHLLRYLPFKDSNV